MTPRSQIEPIINPIPANRQGAKRHYGVHPYFTRRPFNVVREYVKRYSYEGDIVLDPFGGSGVTAIEAFLENRVGIQNDINPLANFVANGIAALGELDRREFSRAVGQLEQRCKEKIHKLYSLKRLKSSRLTHGLHLPNDIALPTNSDVGTYNELFTPKQLIALAILRTEIDQIKQQDVRNALLLAWSASLAKLNRTFLSTKGRAESRGGSSIFSIYRYKIASEPIELPPWAVFYERASNVLRASIEISKILGVRKQRKHWSGKFFSYSEDIEDLATKFENSADYIFTDPPYGGNISYLDLSILWNNWLGILPDEATRAKELIVGGEMKLSEESYSRRLYNSIKSCFRMLKDERWLSVVFQHWNISYFEAILSAAEDSGAILKSAISQVGDPIWSMHKKKGKESVLAGEMILTFVKNRKGFQKKKRNGLLSLEDLIDEVLANHGKNSIYGEYLFNLIIIESWKSGTINRLNVTKENLSNILKTKGWQYDSLKHCWTRRSGRHSYQMALL